MVFELQRKNAVLLWWWSPFKALSALLFRSCPEKIWDQWRFCLKWMQKSKTVFSELSDSWNYSSVSEPMNIEYFFNIICKIFHQYLFDLKLYFQVWMSLFSEWLHAIFIFALIPGLHGRDCVRQVHQADHEGGDHPLLQERLDHRQKRLHVPCLQDSRPQVEDHPFL